MSKLVILTALGLIAYITYFYIKSLKPEHRKKAGLKAGAFAFLAVIIVLAITGKLHALTALGAGLLLFAKRLFPFIRYLPVLKGLYQKSQAKKGASAGNQSTVDTSYLKMTLDHDSGRLNGEVLEGEYKGQLLSSLTLQQLQSVFEVCQAQYPDSVEVLVAFLDREYGDEWQDAFQQQRYQHKSSESSAGGGMTVNEAYSVLGLDAGASLEEVKLAHKKLMQKLHPDRGGSDYLAAKINEAKDLLVKALG